MKLGGEKFKNQIFGGEWTERKLDTVERYLNAYTIALRNKFSDLVYVDLFAGTGLLEREDRESPLTGSALRALKVEPSFDRFIFVEKDADKCKKLRKNIGSKNNVKIYQNDANQAISKIDVQAPNCRGVIFLDPFAADIKYSTVEEISELECLDLWMLFPTQAVTRMLSRDKKHATGKKLIDLYGNDDWTKLYNTHQSTFNDTKITYREKGTEKSAELYKEKLQKTFGTRLLKKSLLLKNPKGTPLFELIFCTGSPKPKAIEVSHNIAKYIIAYKDHNKLQKTLGDYS